MQRLPSLTALLVLATTVILHLSSPAAFVVASAHEGATGEAAFDAYNCSCVELAKHEAEEAAAAAEAAASAAEEAAEAAAAGLPTTTAEWLSGVAASIIVSALSLVGILSFHFVPEVHRDRALQALLGLAFGTLIGGTFLNLLPEAAEELGKFDINVSSVCMCGILFGYLTERLTHWASGGTHSHTHSDGHVHGAHSPGDHGKPQLLIEMRTVHVSTPVATGPAATSAAAIPASGCTSDDPLAFSRDPTDVYVAAAAAPAPVVTGVPAANKPTHGGKRVSGADRKAWLKLSPLAILSLSGDAIHNFVDGLVIGAAFASSINTGIITAVVIGVHEIPQEIGDFGILIRSGLTVTQALLANLAVACTCIIGAIVTLAIGTELGSNVNYTLPFAAGVFLYLALGGVVPEMQRYISDETRDDAEQSRLGRPSRRLKCCGYPLSMTTLAGTGIVIGVALMGLLTLLPAHGGEGAHEEGVSGDAGHSSH